MIGILKRGTVNFVQSVYTPAKRSLSIKWN